MNNRGEEEKEKMGKYRRGDINGENNFTPHTTTFSLYWKTFSAMEYTWSSTNSGSSLKKFCLYLFQYYSYYFILIVFLVAQI